jgi:xanthine dehydrogenase accessory factor
MLNFWSKVLYELDCYVKVFVALVVEHQKGSPGTTSSQLLLTEGSEVIGTIGGGVMESQLLEEAEKLLKTGNHPPTLRTVFHRSTGVSEKSGLICGGSQTILTMVLHTDHREVLRDMVYRLRYDQPGSLVISPAGLTLEEEDLTRPSLRFEGSEDNWQIGLGLLNRRRVHVVGCGHCGIALVRQMHMLGFNVTIVEPRENLHTTADLPSELKISFLPFSSAGKNLNHANMTFAVVMTPSFRDDVASPVSFYWRHGKPVKAETDP